MSKWKHGKKVSVHPGGVGHLDSGPRRGAPSLRLRADGQQLHEPITLPGQGRPLCTGGRQEAVNPLLSRALPAPPSPRNRGPPPPFRENSRVSRLSADRGHPPVKGQHRLEDSQTRVQNRGCQIVTNFESTQRSSATCKTKYHRPESNKCVNKIYT